MYWLAFARALEYTGYYVQAEQAYRRVFAISDASMHNAGIAHFWLAYLLMLQNRFKEALEFYEHCLVFAKSEVFSPLHYNLAREAFLQDSNVFKGKEICVYCEQGFGDTLMFMRTLQALCVVAKKCIFRHKAPCILCLKKNCLGREVFLRK